MKKINGKYGNLAEVLAFITTSVGEVMLEVMTAPARHPPLLNNSAILKMKLVTRTGKPLEQAQISAWHNRACELGLLLKTRKGKEVYYQFVSNKAAYLLFWLHEINETAKKLKEEQK